MLVTLWMHGDYCSVQVEGLEEANHILAALSESFVFKTIEPFGEIAGRPDCTFRIDLNPPLSLSRLARLFTAIRGVVVRIAPG